MAAVDFLIRADGSDELGLGHVNRCLLLAGELRALGCRTTLAVTDTSLARRFLEGAEVLFLPPDAGPEFLPPADIAVVDLYRYDAAFYRALGNISRKIAMFDDTAFIVPPGVGAVINTGPNVLPSQYPARVKAICGPAYLPIRPEFQRTRGGPEGQDAFLCLGASFLPAETARLARVALGACSCRIHVVSAATASELHRAGCPDSPRLLLHAVPAPLPQLIAASKFALCSAGSIFFEIAAMGVPACCCCLAENQRRISAALAELGAALSLGTFDEFTDSELAQSIIVLDTDPETRRRLSGRAASLCDGNGAQRLASELMAWRKEP